jgi:hypothetical protein
MINSIKLDFAKFQKEIDPAEKIRQLEILNERLLKVIVSPNYSKYEKEEAKSLIMNLAFSFN